MRDGGLCGDRRGASHHDVTGLAWSILVVLRTRVRCRVEEERDELGAVGVGDRHIHGDAPQDVISSRPGRIQLLDVF